MNRTRPMALLLTVAARPRPTSGKPRYVAVLIDRASGLDMTCSREIFLRIQNEGMSAEAVSCAQLADAPLLTSERLVALVLTHSLRLQLLEGERVRIRRTP